MMTYERACELLKLSPKRPVAVNARVAAFLQDGAPINQPLRYAVAQQVVINAAK